ncbi:hypothetical protein CPC08DRAFT_762003 [Agrocybe pediades]|nr:hypothetical protein CPC08DRAFT_762003 [Agrocybe pediades]
MKFITTAFILFAASLSAMAASARKPRLMLCTDADLDGECVSMKYKDEQCVNVPGRINDQVSSVAPDGSGHKCTLYRDYDCEGPSFEIEEHVDFLSNFNDRLSSFKCSS